MTTKLVFDTLVDIERDDGGASLQLEVNGPSSETFIRFLSWDETHEHAEMRAFMGKRIRMTVEVLEEEPDTSTMDPVNMTRGQLAIEEDRISQELKNYVIRDGNPVYAPTGETLKGADLIRHTKDRQDLQDRRQAVVSAIIANYKA